MANEVEKGVEAAKDLADKAKAAAEGAVEAAKDAIEGAADKVEDIAGDALAAAKSALGGAAAAAEGVADKVEDMAGDALAAAKSALGGAAAAAEGVADKVEDMAGDALAAAKGALDDAGATVAGAAAAAGGAAKASVTKMTNLAGQAVGGAGEAAAGAADAVKDAAGDALAAAKGALGGAGAAAAGIAGAGAALVGGAAAAATAAASGVTARATGAAAPGFGAGLRARDAEDRDGGGGAAPPLGALDKQPDNLLFWGTIIVGGIAALGVAAWLFVQVGKTPVAAPAPANTENTTVVAATPAPAVAGMPTWLASINGSLKEVFSWLGLDFRSNKVLVSGEAPDQASKDAALKQATDLIRGTPDGANVAIIDGITVPGGAAPVGAAFAALGASPDVAACQTAFVDTMAGRTINFTVGSAEISADSAAILDALSGVASACQAHAIEIGGHTDKTGDPAANTALSQARADAVKVYWESRAVPVTSVTTKGYGPDKPVDPADTPEAYAANRRIEFIVTAAP